MRKSGVSSTSALEPAAKFASTAPRSIAIISPGLSPFGADASAASFTVVEAQTCSTPRCGSVTSAVCAPAVTLPLAAITALSCVTSSDPVTVFAAAGSFSPSGTIAMGAVCAQSCAAHATTASAMHTSRSSARTRIGLTCSGNCESSAARPRSTRSRDGTARLRWAASCGAGP